MKVAIIWNHLFHYRIPLYRLLGQVPGVDLTVLHGGLVGPAGGARAGGPDDSFRSVTGTTKMRRLAGAVLYLQTGLLKHIRRGRFDVIVCEGNFGILSNLPVLLYGRFAGIPVLMWTAGWERGRITGLAALLVLAPADTVTPGLVSPRVRIRNFGANPVNNVPLICEIDSVGYDTTIFADTANYTGPFAPSETVDVTFPKSWTGAVGRTYQVAIYTTLPEDPVYRNDTAYASVTINPSEAVDEQGPRPGASFDYVMPTLGRDRVRINFTVARRGAVNLGVYDAAGLLVRTLVDGTLDSGSQSATWDRTDSNGRRVANGAYLYRLTVDGKTVSSKSVLFN